MLLKQHKLSKVQTFLLSPSFAEVDPKQNRVAVSRVPVSYKSDLSKWFSLCPESLVYIRPTLLLSLPVICTSNEDLDSRWIFQWMKTNINKRNSESLQAPNTTFSSPCSKGDNAGTALEISNPTKASVLKAQPPTTGITGRWGTFKTRIYWQVLGHWRQALKRTIRPQFLLFAWLPGSRQLPCWGSLPWCALQPQDQSNRGQPDMYWCIQDSESRQTSLFQLPNLRCELIQQRAGLEASLSPTGRSTSNIKILRWSSLLYKWCSVCM